MLSVSIRTMSGWGTKVASSLACVALACAPGDDAPCGTCPPSVESIRWVTYHGDVDRIGCNRRERELLSSSIRTRGMEQRWSSPPLDAEIIDGVEYPPHIYATPLWLDDVALAGADVEDAVLPVVIAATSNGWAYAIVAEDRACEGCDARAGTIAWSRRLVDAAPVERLDGGMPMGTLSTPFADLDAEPPRLYVAAMDREAGWLAFALDLGSGEVLAGWPVAIDDASLAPVNRNGPARMQAPEVMSQRGALAVAGDRLYVPFGTYRGEGVGWLAAIDTSTASLASAFSSAPWSELDSNGGIWGAGGPAIDGVGNLWITTGNSPADSGPSPAVWGNSLLQLDRDLRLIGTYTPFNYCWLDEGNMDIGGSAAVLLPELPATSTPFTVAFGGKQGNVYLVDRTTLARDREARPGCSSDASSDGSLLPPDVQPQFGTRGPLNVFGPYSEEFGELDYAKMRSKPAFAIEGDERFLYVAGSTKAAVDSDESVPPALAKLRIVTPEGEPAHLEIAAMNDAVAFVNPGSPIVAADDDRDGVVWVVDENAPRIASLLDPATPKPVLYAFDAGTLELVWRSDDGQLAHGGKYGTPVVAHGVVVVGTDRITAFGLAD
jgi:outer membrane protein assembly factor BamB